MLSRWSDVLFADISDAICEVMALYRMAFVFWGVVGTIRWTFAVRVNGRTGRTVNIMTERECIIGSVLFIIGLISGYAHGFGKGRRGR